MLRPCRDAVPVPVVTHPAALKLGVDVVPELGEAIVAIWVVLELDACLHLLHQRLANVAAVDKAQGPGSKLEQEDEDDQHEVRGQQASALEPGPAAPEEGHEEGDRARGEAQAVGAQDAVRGQQRRVATVRHVQPHAHARHAAAQNPEEQVVAAQRPADARVARLAHGAASHGARIRRLS